MGMVRHRSSRPDQRGDDSGSDDDDSEHESPHKQNPRKRHRRNSPQVRLVYSCAWLEQEEGEMDGQDRGYFLMALRAAGAL